MAAGPSKVLIPVNRIATGKAGILQVDPVIATFKVRAVKTGGLGANVVTVLVTPAAALRKAHRLLEVGGAAVFAGGDGQFGRSERVSREQPHTKAGARNGGVLIFPEIEGIAYNKSEVDRPRIQVAVNGTVAVKRVCHGGSSRQHSAGGQEENPCLHLKSSLKRSNFGYKNECRYESDEILRQLKRCCLVPQATSARECRIAERRSVSAT